MMRSIIVTGGFGVLGHAVAEAFALAGEKGGAYRLRVEPFQAARWRA